MSQLSFPCIRANIRIPTEIWVSWSWPQWNMSQQCDMAAKMVNEILKTIYKYLRDSWGIRKVKLFGCGGHHCHQTCYLPKPSPPSSCPIPSYLAPFHLLCQLTFIDRPFPCCHSIQGCSSFTASRPLVMTINCVLTSQLIPHHPIWIGLAVSKGQRSIRDVVSVDSLHR